MHVNPVLLKAMKRSHSQMFYTSHTVAWKTENNSLMPERVIMHVLVRQVITYSKRHFASKYGTVVRRLFHRPILTAHVRYQVS